MEAALRGEVISQSCGGSSQPKFALRQRRASQRITRQPRYELLGTSPGPCFGKGMTIFCIRRNAESFEMGRPVEMDAEDPAGDGTKDSVFDGRKNPPRQVDQTQATEVV